GRRSHPRAKPQFPCFRLCRRRRSRPCAGRSGPCCADPAGAPRPPTAYAMKPSALLALVLSASLLSGCGLLTRLSEVGRDPAMTPTSDPTKEPTWRPVTMPMPPREPTPNEANALWRSGSRAFFKDQRAAQVGDIVTILVGI